MEAEGDVTESYDRLKLLEPLSENAPETVSVPDNLILWTGVTGINRNYRQNSLLDPGSMISSKKFLVQVSLYRTVLT